MNAEAVDARLSDLDAKGYEEITSPEEVSVSRDPIDKARSYITGKFNHRYPDGTGENELLQQILISQEGTRKTGLRVKVFRPPSADMPFVVIPSGPIHNLVLGLADYTPRNEFNKLTEPIQVEVRGAVTINHANIDPGNKLTVEGGVVLAGYCRDSRDTSRSGGIIVMRPGEKMIVAKNPRDKDKGKYEGWLCAEDNARVYIELPPDKGDRAGELFSADPPLGGKREYLYWRRGAQVKPAPSRRVKLES